jgi:exosortase
MPLFRDVRPAWAGVAVFAAAWVWELARFWGFQPGAGWPFWGLQPGDADKFLILAGSGWLAYQAWPEITAKPARPSWLGVPLVFLGAVVFPVGWYVFVQVGPRPILLWWGYACLLAMTAGLLAATRGWPAVRRLAFPLLFAALTPPIPGRINSPLQHFLQGVTTTLAHQGLAGLGFDVVREGFVLRLPGGDLGVIEACSGVRSVTALTAIALFLAHVRGLGVLRGAVVLACAIPVIILVNATRVLVSGLLQEWFGQAAIMGWKHEVLGFAAVFLGLALVAGITAMLRPRSAGAPPPPAGPAADPRRGPEFASGVSLLLGLALAAAAYALPSLANPVDAAAESIDHIAPVIESPAPDGGPVRWKARDDIPIPDELANKLTYTRGVNRVYKEPYGDTVTVFAFHWTSATAVKGYHHPDICMPSQGLVERVRSTEPVVTPGGRTVPVTYREYVPVKEDLAIAYWTQEGRRVWTDADEATVFSFRYPFLWVRDRLATRRGGDVDDRLQFWCYARWVTNAREKDRFLRFVGALADDVYRVCPWADPGPATDAANKR